MRPKRIQLTSPSQVISALSGAADDAPADLPARESAGGAAPVGKNPGPPAGVEQMAAECTAAIEEALKRFGTYSYYDRGAREVMEMDMWVQRVQALAPAEVGQMLLLVLGHEHGRPFGVDLVHTLDSVYDDDQWTQLMAVDEEVAELYG